MRPVTLALSITLASSLALVGCGESKTPETPSPEAAEAAPKDSPKDSPKAKAEPVADKAKAEPTAKAADAPKPDAPKAGDTPADKAADPVAEKGEKPAVAETPKPWLKKPPRLQVVDQGQGISGLLSSCKLHLSGGNSKWAEAACHHALNKGLKKGYKDMPGLFYRLGTVYARRGKKDDAKACYQEALRLNPEHAPSKKRLDRMNKKK